MSETEFVLFQNIIGGIETFLYAVCLTAFFYPFMTEKKERQGSKLKKILIVFGSYIAISLIGNFVPAYGWLGLMIVIILLTASSGYLGMNRNFTFFMGILAAWMVVRISHPLVKTILDGIFTIPLVLPPTVAGFFLLYVFGVKRPVGQFFLEYFSVKIAFSWGATVLAAVVMSFPLMYRSARGAFEQVDDTLVQAARTLGMGEWTIFRKVLLANAVPGVVSGGVLAFARGLGEFGATAMIAGNIAGKTRTLPMAVYSEVAAGNMEAAYSYVAIIVVIAFLSVFLMNGVMWYSQKKSR